MAIDISKYTYRSLKLDKNYRIVQISDYHNNHKINVLEKVVELKPDLIVITGDLIDRRRYDLKVALQLVANLVKIAKCYYVCGNHELWSDKNYAKIKAELEKLHVVVLDDTSIQVGAINLIGIKDPALEAEIGHKVYYNSRVEAAIKNNIKTKMLNILLAHRPEFIEEYAKYPLDIVFSGHVHGGQFIIAKHGLYGPNQGVLPKYFQGQYQVKQTTMYLSRGLGNSRFPIRINNNFEIIVVDLVKE